MNSLDHGIIPAHARRGDYVPTIGSFLQVTLPGEIVRTEVLELYGRDAALVKIISVVLGKGGAMQRTGDTVAVKRSATEFNEIWVPISDREVREDEERRKAERFAKEEAERRAREDAERQAALEAQPVGEAHPEVTHVTKPEPAMVERPAAARPRKRAGRR